MARPRDRSRRTTSAPSANWQRQRERARGIERVALLRNGEQSAARLTPAVGSAGSRSTRAVPYRTSFAARDALCPQQRTTVNATARTSRSRTRRRLRTRGTARGADATSAHRAAAPAAERPCDPGVLTPRVTSKSHHQGAGVVERGVAPSGRSCESMRSCRGGGLGRAPDERHQCAFSTTFS